VLLLLLLSQLQATASFHSMRHSWDAYARAEALLPLLLLLSILQATASFDTTWRFWDVETGACLMEQEGHSRQVYAVAFHPDGSLAGSAGLDAFGECIDIGLTV
jgi:WD40 repeat protein